MSVFIRNGKEYIAHSTPWESFSNISRKLSHPSPDKRFKLPKLALLWGVGDDSRELLTKVRTICNVFHRFEQPTMQFKASFTSVKDLLYGAELLLDLIFLDGKAFLHIVDTTARFSVATFLDAQYAYYGQSIQLV